MQYMLMGFDQDAGVRLYAFKGIADGKRTDFTVEVELALIPGYGIRIQELPLLCRELLERRLDVDARHALTVTAEEMRDYAGRCAAARDLAAQKRKRKAPAESNTASWTDRRH